jgi:hypothetical protein
MTINDISLHNNDFTTINQFLSPFQNIDSRLTREIFVDFEISSRKHITKRTPILKFAKPEDSELISKLYKEVYKGSYPYKENEDISALKDMIESEKYEFIIIKDNRHNSVGSFKFILDFDKKRGYMGGFMLKKEYRGHIDMVKALMGSVISMWSRYNDRILLWYIENRTAHTKSQFMSSMCGIKPVAFFPNKDIFFNKTESDIMHIIYDEKALRKHRTGKVPQIIETVKKIFDYSNRRYNLIEPEIVTSKYNLDTKKIANLREKLNINIVDGKFGYKKISFSFQDSHSFFSFLYTASVQNFEKTEYNVDNLEELYVFIKEFERLAKYYDVQYCEVFVSAYKPHHQRMFFTNGFEPRGYIPSWDYNKNTGKFEDNIVFNKYDGIIDKNIKILSEGLELLETLSETV